MLIFAAFVYGLDRYEKEPRHLLFGVFLWGLFVAGIGAFIINTSFQIGLTLFTDSEAGASLTTSTLVAPIIEEFLKGLVVLLVYIRKRREFDSILDGIIYASIAALGFAALENTYYIYEYGYLKDGISGIFFLVFVRVILVGWQHPFYTAFFGIGLAYHRLHPAGFWRNAAPIIGLGIGIITHSLHNLFSSTAQEGGAALAATAFDWLGWGFMFLFIQVMIRRERKLLVTNLLEEVEFGILTPEQYSTAINSTRRWKVQWKALFTQRWRLTRHFYQLCGEIAHKKNQLNYLGDEQGNTHIIDLHRMELRRLSPFIES